MTVELLKVDLTKEEIIGILTYMYYGINECGEITNTEQNAYTKIYNTLKESINEVPDYITKPDELTCYNSEREEYYNSEAEE